MPKDIRDIQQKLLQFKEQGKSMFVTSSFQSQSMALLHIISQTDTSIPVYFINTGYHFPETIVYKNKVASLLGLQLLDLLPLVPKNNQRTAQGDLLFTFDPDYCCYLNKVQPVKKLLENFDIWINGVRSDQSPQRSTMDEMQPTNGRAVRYHPMLAWTKDDIEEYINHYRLPRHPLDAKGYKSIGCEPCTRPQNGSDLRDGRWYGMKKTECGLHSESLCSKKR